jgi:hypothetical protein
MPARCRWPVTGATATLARSHRPARDFAPPPVRFRPSIHAATASPAPDARAGSGRRPAAGPGRDPAPCPRQQARQPRAGARRPRAATSVAIVPVVAVAAPAPAACVRLTPADTPLAPYRLSMTQRAHAAGAVSALDDPASLRRRRCSALERPARGARARRGGAATALGRAAASAMPGPALAVAPANSAAVTKKGHEQVTLAFPPEPGEPCCLVSASGMLRSPCGRVEV